MTKIRAISDLHLETIPHLYRHSNSASVATIVPKMPDDEDTILVIAGDIHYISRMEEIEAFFKELSKRFFAVVVVSGNHEYWNGNMIDADHQYAEFLSKWNNIHFLQNDHVKIKDVTFYGCTLWTELKEDHDVYYAQYGMVDYRKTRIGGAMLHAKDTQRTHNLMRYQLMKFCESFDENEKLYIVTHHGPSFKSCNKRFEGSPLNAAFYSHMDEFVKVCKAKVWHHGHTHASQRYMIGSTIVICNPMGYNMGNENIYFEPKLVLDI